MSDKPLTATEIKNRWKELAKNPSLSKEYAYIFNSIKAKQEEMLLPLIARLKKILAKK